MYLWVHVYMGMHTYEHDQMHMYTQKNVYIIMQKNTL